MSDIVQQLRGSVPAMPGSGLLLRAAAEVEQLRAEKRNNDRLLAECERRQGLLRGLSRDMAEEIERLTRELNEARAALEAKP